MDDDFSSEEEEEETDAEEPEVALDIPREAFASNIAQEAGLMGLRAVSATLAEHAGFDGTLRGDTGILFGVASDSVPCSATTGIALEVLANLAAEYLMNAGHTMRFFLDRFGHSFSAEVCII
jgi:hypothetical protein